MIKRILTLLVCFSFGLGIKSPVWADTAVAGKSASLNHKTVVKKEDTRIRRLESFLTKYNSPLTPHTRQIVALADKYQLDWRLVAAISGVESTFCKAIPYNSYNCWGWNNGKHAFQSYPHALETVSKTLGINYYSRGFDTPEAIGPIYAPPSRTWAAKVRFFMNQLEADTQATFLAKQFSI